MKKYLSFQRIRNLISTVVIFAFSMSLFTHMTLNVNADETTQTNSIKFGVQYTYTNGTAPSFTNFLNKELTYTEPVYMYYYYSEPSASRIEMQYAFVSAAKIPELATSHNPIVYNGQNYYVYTASMSCGGTTSTMTADVIMETDGLSTTYIRKCNSEILVYSNINDFIAAHLNDTIDYVEQRIGIITGDNIVAEYLYGHQHYGDSTSGGGCYTKAVTHTHTSSCYLVPHWGSICNTSDYINPDGSCGCGNAGCIVQYGESKLDCSTTTTYELGCGIEEGATIGNIVMTYDESSDGKYYLNVFSSDCISISKVTWSDSGLLKDIRTKEVTSNGTYTANVSYTADGISSSTKLSYTVTDYDITPPTVNLSYSDTAWEKSKKVTINASDVGLGLADEAYRFYDGTTWSNWSSTTQYTINKNGSYSVEVRDKKGLVTKKDFTITHVDSTTPIVNISYDDETWSTTKTISITSAYDNESGLAENPYRIFIGSAAWTTQKDFTVTNNGSYTLQIKNGVELVTTVTVNITHIDTMAPTVTIAYDDNAWTKEKTLSVAASDAEMGLAAKPYRYSEDGSTWSDWSSNNTYTVTKNGTYYVEVKDNANLVTQKQVTITHIDTTIPNVTLAYDDTNWTKNKTISVTASDTPSGLNNTAYRFYNGTEWGSWGATNSFTVSQNGTYKIAVRDVANNTNTQTINITHIDNQKPTVTMSCDDSVWTKEKTITITANDSGIGLSATPYRYSEDGSTWSEWSNTNTYTASKNGTYYVQVRDDLGNTESKTLSITHIDTTNPTLTVSYNDTNWEKNKTVTLTASDSQSGLHAQPYRFNDGTSWNSWSTSTSYTITSNGTYKLAARDSLGNIQTKTFTITHIDTTAPEVTLTYNDTNWEKSKSVTINATDNESGLHSTAYRFYDGTSWSNWSATKTYTVTENGSYSLEVRDTLENTKKVDFTVSKIDNVIPTVSVDYNDTNWEKSKNITINATDNESGLHSTAYRFYDGTSWSNWSATKTYTITENGSYSVEVRDFLSNTKKVDFTISKIDNINPTISADYNDIVWEQSKDITINATDNESGLNDKAYSFYNGNIWGEWTTNNVFTVTENGSYEFKVRDALNNTGSISVTITHIDNTAPTVSLIYDDTEWEQEKQIEISASDTQSGLHENAFRFFDGENWSEWTNNKFISIIKNGTYKVEVRDMLENTSSNTFSISHIDATSPSVELDADESVWTTDKVITVTASDDESGLPEKPYRYSEDDINWSEWVSENIYVVSKNGTYYVEVRNSIGLTTKKEIEIAHIDTICPSVEVIYDSDNWETNKTVQINASDNESGLHSAAYRINDGTSWSEWTNENSYTISKNGTYTVEVRDNANNIISKSFTIDLIDGIKPIISVDFDDTLWEFKKEVTINAIDNESGLAEEAYRYSNDGSNWSEWASSNAFTVNNNGHYYVEVRDKVGLTTKIEFTITHIDNEKPVVSIEYDENTITATVTVVVVASDNGSGLHETAYRFHNGAEWSDWTNSNTYTYNKNGIYSIEVRDVLGNTTLESVEIKTIDTTAPDVEIVIDDAIWSFSKTLVVNAVDAGVGLHENPYRYSEDGTNWSEWTANNTYNVEKNGTYYVETRDMLDNSCVKEIEITHVDIENPEVTLIYDSATWLMTVPVKVEASDNGSGLHETAYRFYNGAEWSDWTKVSEYEITQNGDYKIEVRDRLEQKTCIDFTISNIDDIAPVFDYSVDYFDMKDDTVFVKITNIVENESGLHDEPYSFDGGLTWVSKDNAYLYANNCHTLVVRDKCLNETSMNIALNCIMTADVELLEESDALVKELYANFKITLNNYTSYTLVRQYQVGALPQLDKWEEIIIDNDKFVEDVLVTTTNSNGLLSRTLTLRVKGNDLDDYMYGVLVRYQNEAGENIQSPLYVYDELYTDSFTATPLEESIQAGKTLYVNDFHKVITYNNNLKRVVLPEDKYMDFITFEDGSLSITPRTVGCYSDSLWVEYKISSAEGCFELDVYDSETPIINSINIDNYEMIDDTSEKEFLFTIDATDNSDGQLYYAILPVGMSTDINYEPSNQISYTFNNNTYANIYVRDESGNTQKELYYVCYIDLNEPVIKSCDVSPDITTPAQNYVVTVTAEDDCTQAADLEYKFVLDGIVIRDYNKDNTCNINQNGELRIFARDKVGRETEYKNTLVFHYADTLAPAISDVSIKSSTNYVLATVFAEDNLSKDLIYGCNSYAFSKTQKENFFTISQSGDYTFFVIDEAGNKVEKTVYINVEEVTSNSSLYSIVRNISVKSLGNTYEYNGDKYTNSGYEVAVTFIKEVDEASTLTSLNGTEYSQTYYYTLDENGTYTLNSRYTAEESEYTGPIVYTNTVTVNGIDKTKPSISITSKNGTAMVNVKDDMSGINKIVIQAKDTDNTTSEKVFTMKNGQLSASRTISIDENKVYQCYAVDNVGNKSKTLAVSSGGIIETETNVKTYNVVFVSEQGGILKIQEVVEGYPATAPEAPEKNSYKFTSWSEDFSEVKRDLYIYPLYERLPVSEVVEPHYDEALRYELIKDTFSFSSKYSGNTLSPVNKLVSNNPYTDETYTFKKFTMPDKKAFSGVMVKEKETILEKIDITNPFVYIPLLILIIIIVVSYLIKRKYTKEY